MNTRTTAIVAVLAALAVGVIGYSVGLDRGGSGETAGGEFLSANAAEMPAGLTDEQRKAVEAMIAEAMAAGGGAVAQADQTALSEAQIGEIRDLIRTHLIENPEIIAEAINELQARQEQAEVAAQVNAIADNAGIIFTSDKHVVLGNLDGDTTLVEFFDYNCHFCQRAMADLQRLMDEDPDLRIVLKEFPVLGDASVEAARVSVAVNLVAPEKFLEFHFALLDGPGRKDGERALSLAEDMGLNRADLEALLDSDAVKDAINEVYEIAGALNLSGTPSYVTEREVIVGAVGYDNLATSIADVRSN